MSDRREVVLHLPHASTCVPARERAAFLLSDDALARELLRVTDHYTDELFSGAAGVAHTVAYPVSRLVVDPERFVDDAVESMAGRGLGVIYTCTSEGTPLRHPPDAAERARLLDSYYHPHHRALTQAVGAARELGGRCLIIDAHSFPSSPLPCDRDQTPERPDVGLGTDSFHTPAWLVEAAAGAFRGLGWAVAVDRPYPGTMVPQAVRHRDQHVYSIMVEVSRARYLDEGTGERLPEFAAVRAELAGALEEVIGTFHRE